jgi:drug/metabolite transporter (DMT)-like permease
MDMPFTAEQFHDVFRAYNEAVWPSQIVLIGLALVGIFLAMRPRRWSHAVVSAILAVLWAWLAVAYHIAFFSRINPLAYAFAALSLVGAAIFVWDGVVQRRLRFEWNGSIRSWSGAAFVGFALVLYPAWSSLAGHGYHYMPTFGLPCPTTLYTVGMLSFLVAPYSRRPHVVPIVWSAIGAQAAFFLAVPQDLSLIVAGLAGVVLLLRNNPKAI